MGGKVGKRWGRNQMARRMGKLLRPRCACVSVCVRPLNVREKM